jgi:DNA-binding CsgD family transcriptional regulator
MAKRRLERSRGRVTGTTADRFSPIGPVHVQEGSVAEDGALRVVTFRIGTDEFAVVSLAQDAVDVHQDIEQAPEPPGRARLTEAERAVVDLTLSGLSNRAMARKRGTSPSTIANQLAGIYKKLGLSSRSQLALLHSAQRKGACSSVPPHHVAPART